MLFFLGTHHPAWLSRLDVPLFVSRRRLADYRTAPRVVCPWALDSGGFTELSRFGRWTVTPGQYVREVTDWQESVGLLAWCAIQDWMCEPWILAKTGRSVREYQELTVASYLELRGMAPGVPWVPVLQGWKYDDYFDHVEQYRAAGVNLASLPLVGLGSVCRRQATGVAEELIRDLAAEHIRLHGFGFKIQGLRRVSRWLASSDSMAWSLAARRDVPLPGCEHASCANCPRYAMRWRSRCLEAIREGVEARIEPRLF